MGEQRSLLHTEPVVTCVAGMGRTGVWVSLLRCHIKLDKFRKDETRCSLLRKSGILSVPDGFFFGQHSMTVEGLEEWLLHRSGF